MLIKFPKVFRRYSMESSTVPPRKLTVPHSWFYLRLSHPSAVLSQTFVFLSLLKGAVLSLKSLLIS